MRKTHWISSIFILCLSILCLSAFCSENKDHDSLFTVLSKISDDTAKVNLLLNLSDKTSWSDVKSSEAYAKQALQLSNKINYIKGLGYSKYHLAKVYADYELDFSEDLILQSLRHAQELNDSILIAKTYNVLGNLKSTINLTDDAFVFYKRALGIFLRYEQDSAAAGIYNNLGILHAYLKDDSLSIEYYLKAADINTRTGNYLWLAINYLNIGNDYMDFGKLDEGLVFLHKSLNIARENNFNRLYPWIYNNFSHYHYLQRNYQKTIKFGKEALETAENNSNTLQARSALVHLKNAYYQLENLEMAYLYLEELNIINDSISKHSRLKELDFLEMKYKYEDEQKTLELERKLLEAKHYRKELTYVIILLVAGFVILTFVFIFITLRNRIRRKDLVQANMILEKEKMSKELAFKNKELTTYVMYLLKKNEFISQISEKLKNTNLTTNNSRNNAIDKVIIELDKSISNDNWGDFEVRFQEVHVGFYNRLSRKFPDLTPNELRLCAFLRLNMTSKEIADITFRSPESLKTARYRLRKKIGIERGENLVSFLTQF